jgi:hypothetical protein
MFKTTIATAVRYTIAFVIDVPVSQSVHKFSPLGNSRLAALNLIKFNLIKFITLAA